MRVTRHHSCRVSPFGHPRINARLAAPRGITQPPTSFIGSQCQGIHHALLNTYNTKNQFEKRNCTSITHKQPPTQSRNPEQAHHLRARCSQPLSTNQTPHPTTKDGATTRRPRQRGATRTPGHGPVVSKPNSVFGSTRQPPKGRSPSWTVCLSCTRPPPTTGRPHHWSHRGPSNESIRTPNPHTMWAGLILVVLLRKEVIQPHLPVRLPCYDFVPIADPTFDGSLPQGVRPPASGVTDFHDVTGGVYKARERIHRSVADLRLLATPTSRGRVADPDPN